MKDKIRDKHSNIEKSFQAVFNNEVLLAKVIEFFPYPILIYAADGKLIMTNQAMLKDYFISIPQELIGTYNVLTEPFIIKSGILADLKRAFQGETVILSDIKVPLEDMAERYSIPDSDIEALYQDITIFPIFDAYQKVSFIVVLLINRRVYRSKDEISRAKEYMENHWLDRFDVGKVAKASGLSRAHFSRLFKKHTGITPHNYYINYKINRIKKQLLDYNLSISQAFADCGVDYNGHFAKVFKKEVGVSPSDYRKAANQGK